MRFVYLRWLLLCGWLGLPLVVYGDLRVSVPPGAPLEWLSELPVRVLDEAFAAPRGPRYTAGGRPEERKAPPKGGRTSVAEKEIEAPERLLRSAPPVGAFNPLSRARIATQDIVGHEAWTRFAGGGLKRAYPPALDEGLHWFSVATLLMPLYYPARCSAGETAQLLVSIGPPVLAVLPPGDWGRGRSREFIAYLRQNIADVPRAPPDVAVLVDAVGDDPELRMLTRWTAQALVADHFFTLDPGYCRYLRLLGSEAIPAVLACSQSRHALLRQNAVGLLARYSSRDPSSHEKVVRQRLLDATGEADGVVRNRALEGLVRVRESEVENSLIAAIESDDAYFRPHALRLLGRLGASDVRDVVHQALRTATSDDRGDMWLAAVQVLATLPDLDKKSRRMISRLVKIVAAKPGVLDLSPEHMLDDPDQPGDRAGVLEQAVRLTVAILGDKKQRRFLSGVLGGRGGGKPKPPFRRMFSEGSLLLAAVSPLNRPLAIHLMALLAAENPEMEASLREIVVSKSDLLLRRLALRAYAGAGLRDRYLAEVADTDTFPSALRLDALYLLAAIPRRRAVAFGAARALVVGYLNPKSYDEGKPAISRADECITALRLLAEEDKLDAALVGRVLAAAIPRKDHARFERGGAGRRAVPPVVETALLALAKFEASVAVPQLLSVLTGKGPGRVEAVLVLGMFPSRAAAEALVVALADNEPWVRYAAYRALRGISGERHFADWLFGDVAARASAHEAWAEWLDRAQLPDAKAKGR